MPSTKKTSTFNSFIHSFLQKHVLITYYVLGTLLSWVIHQEPLTLNRSRGKKNTNLKFIFSLCRHIKSRIWELEFKKSTCLYNLSQNGKWLYQIMLRIIAFKASLEQSYFLHCWVWVEKKKGYVILKFFLNWYTFGRLRWPLTFWIIWKFCASAIFLIQASLPHTVFSCQTWSVKSAFSRRRVSWFSLVGVLHPLPASGIWHW